MLDWEKVCEIAEDVLALVVQAVGKKLASKQVIKERQK